MLEQLDTAIGFATVMLLLSLLVTTVVQMVIALLGLRGRCLLDGTEQLLKQLYPDLPNIQHQARTIAEKVLRHPAVGVKDRIWSAFSEENPEGTPAAAKTKLAEAIRPKELILVLKDLADRDPDLQSIKEALKAPFTNTPSQGSAEMVAKAEELLKKMEQSFPEETKDLRTAVESVLGTTQSIAVRVDAWFDTVMDRTSEVFKIYTRRITIAVALLFALALRVDSLGILDQISEDEDLRARLVQMNDTAQESAKETLALENAPLATEAIQELARDENQPGVMQAVAALCAQPDVNLCFTGLRTRQDGESWLNRNLTEPKQVVLEAYDKEFTAVTEAHLKKLGQSFQKLQDHLGETKLEIVPDPILPWGFKDGRNFLGVVMTAFFLSLGAPFWYNALRKLSDLRPIVARRVDGEPLKGAPKQES